MENQNLKDYGICIVTGFYTLDPSYSLVRIAEEQIKMLTQSGYKIKVIVERGLPDTELVGAWADSNVRIERIPPFNRDNDGMILDNYQKDVNELHEALREILKGVKVVLTHDLIAMPAEILLNLAMRKVAEERPDIRFLHMIHSATSPSIRCSDENIRAIIQQNFPNSLILYPNNWDRKRVAINYHCPLDNVICVHHPIDIPEYLGFHELTKELVREKDLLNADVLAVYPARLDRGKQVEYPIKIFAAIKRTGRSVRLVVMDFSSTGGDKVIYRDELKRLAREEGLDDKEITFMSEWRSETNLHSPRQVVRDLMLISNLYIHSSTSETFSLTSQEAIICKNFLVLNHHFPPMRDIYGSKNILYEPFGSAVNSLDGEDGSTIINIQNPKLHFENIANRINYFIDNNPVLDEHRFIRQHRNLEYVFKKELEPLFFCQELKPLF